MQLILVMESNEEAHTDWIYLHAFLLENYAKELADCRVSPVYLSGIQNYKSRPIQKKIQDLEKRHRASGKSVVLYCLDKDEPGPNGPREKSHKAIANYCAEKAYYLAWFCLDIEDVFLGEQVPDEEKSARARQFLIDQGATCLPLGNFRGPEASKRKESNLILVLDQLFKKD